MLQLVTNKIHQVHPKSECFLTSAPDMNRVCSLTENDREAALAFLAVRPVQTDRKSTRLNSSHERLSRMPSSA